MLTSLREQIIQYDTDPSTRTVAITAIEKLLKTYLPKVEEAVILSLNEDQLIEGALGFINIYVDSFNALKYDMINKGIEKVLQGEFQARNARSSAQLETESQQKIVQFLQDGEALKTVMEKVDHVIKNKLPLDDTGFLGGAVGSVVGLAKNRLGALIHRRAN